MYISLNWISDYVDLSGISTTELINKFTLSSAEVEGVYNKGENINGVVTGKIIEISPHPNSKKLSLLKVDVAVSVLDIVCGAPNVAVGQIVPVAVVGAQVGEMKISSAEVAGKISHGMCCSAKELGISDDHAGLLILDNDTPIGMDIKEILNIDDVIFEIDNKSLTNRPDMWGHYGIAREFATLLQRELKSPHTATLKESENKLNVQVTAKDCHRYTAVSLSNITRTISPINMQIRLYYCGMRAINFLTDLTNYVMLEFGQPMHAFDNNLVSSILVESLNEDTNFIALDEKERLLPAGTMVIKSNNQIVAVAGVMGGLDSGITHKTTSVLLESACFDAYSVRKAASNINLRTESSTRFEKSLDPELSIFALKRFVALLQKYDTNVVVTSAVADIYNYKYPKLSISLTKDYIDNFIGVEIAENKIIDILSRLEFEVLVQGVGDYRVLVPSFRATKDIQGRADIVEEIARIYGYDNIQPKSVEQIITPIDKNKEIHMEYEIKHLLATRYSMTEVHSYLWYDAETNKLLDIKASSQLKVINSIQKDNNQIRSTLVPSQLKFVQENKNDLEQFSMFEIGRVVKKKTSNGLAHETKNLIITLVSKTCRDELLIKLKNIIQYAFKTVILSDIKVVKAVPKEDYFNPANYYEIVAGETTLGCISFIHPRIEKQIDKKISIAVAELDFSKILNLEPLATQFETISKYQKCQLDFTFVLDKATLYQEVEKIAHSISAEFLYKVQLIDIFDVATESTKSYTLRYILSSDCRTLLGSELEEFHKKVVQTFENHGIKLKDANLNCNM